MNALVASKAKRNLASRGVMLTLVFCRGMRAGPENAGGQQLGDFLMGGASELWLLAVSLV